MSSVIFSIPVYSFRKLQTPLETQGINTYHCIAPASAIPKDFLKWMDVNAREPSLIGRVPRAIRTTLTETPELFAAYNRGLAILAESVTYDNREQAIELAFGDKSIHGVFDGGHTLSVILDARSNFAQNNGGTSMPEAFCKLEIITGIPSELITDLVDARNTSKQVTSKSLLNLQGSFDPLKTALGPRITNLVSWRENEEAPIDVRDVIALLTAFDCNCYSDSNHPVITYSGKEACLKHFYSNPDCYSKILPLARDILRLWEVIQDVVPEQYNRDIGGKFGKLSGCQLMGKPRELPVTKSQTNYIFPNGYVYPIVAAFRAMIIENEGAYTWGKGISPCKVAREGLANKIFSGAIVNSIKDFRNPNKTGKDTTVWAYAYALAENFYLRQ